MSDDDNLEEGLAALAAGVEGAAGERQEAPPGEAPGTLETAQGNPAPRSESKTIMLGDVIRRDKDPNLKFGDVSSPCHCYNRRSFFNLPPTNTYYNRSFCSMTSQLDS